MRQEQVAERLMVAVQLAVGGDQHQTRLAVRGLGGWVLSGQIVQRERVGVGGRRWVEAHPPAQPLVIEEDGDRAPAGQRHTIRFAGIERLAGGLPGSQDRELDASLGHDRQRLGVHGCLGKPHTLRLAAEAMLEVGDAPNDLGDFIGARGQRHDDMVVGLGHGVAYPIAPHVGPILFDDPSVRRRIVGCHPRKERGANVEADVLKIAELSVRAIAFSVNTLVPVSIRRCAHLGWDLAGERILTRWLIKMTVNTKGSCRHAFLNVQTLIFPRKVPHHFLLHLCWGGDC